MSDKPRKPALVAKRAKPAAASNQRTSGLLGMVPGTGSEKKYTDISAGQNYGAGGAILLLNGVAQGTDANQRIGRKVKWVSILARFVIALGPTPTSFPVRTMLVWDKQTNAAAPAITDILVAASVVSPNNMDNRARFAVLLDWVDDVNTVNKPFLTRTVYLRKTMQTIFSGTANTIGSIASGSLFLVTIGYTGAVAGTTGPQTTFYTRLRYLDDN